MPEKPAPKGSNDFNLNTTQQAITQNELPDDATSVFEDTDLSVEGLDILFGG